MNSYSMIRLIKVTAALSLPAFFAGSLLAATTIYSVPFQASAPAVPHASWKNNPVTLKGAVQSYPKSGSHHLHLLLGSG